MLLQLTPHVVMLLVLALVTLTSAEEAGTHDAVASTNAYSRSMSILIYAACLGLSTPVLLVTAFGFSSYVEASQEFFSGLYVLNFLMVCFNLLIVLLCSITIVFLIPLPLRKHRLHSCCEGSEVEAGDRRLGFDNDHVEMQLGT